MGEQLVDSENEPYFTVEMASEAEHIVEKSRFIGRAFPVTREEEAHALIEQARREHPGATHVCYGMRVGRGARAIDRYHDDGEPSRTAGMPIWQVLEGRELVDTLVIVIRYFGGIKLGTGGLARAYRESARLALEAACVLQYFPEVEMRLCISYALQGKVEHLLEQLEAVRVIEIDFAAEVTLHLAVRRQELDQLRERLAAVLQCLPDEVFGDVARRS